MLTYNLENRGTKKLYEYLYECIKNDILNGTLQENDRLPSKREFAKQHNISTKTVENAYEQLLMEGYISSEEKRGYFVMKIAENNRQQQIRQPFSIYMGSDETEEKCIVDFTSNQAAIDLFPYTTWARIMRNVLIDKEKQLLQTVSFQGIYELRNEIAKYLYAYRGMQVSPDQIVIGAGTEYLYGRLIQLLGRDNKFAIEDPGYSKISQIYKVHGVSWSYVPIDEEGIDIEKLEQTQASVVHVSPGHHFPTGTVMSIGRRQKLLEWAEEKRDRYIIEDDYDSEFRFAKRPIPAIQSLNHNHRVIYFNTFSKTLAPSVRISYMVLPRKLMDRYISTMNFYSCTVSAFEQYAMAQFMEKGYFERHIHRMKNYYRGKRDEIWKELIQSDIWNKVSVEEKDAGNHLLIRVNTDLSDTMLKWQAKEQGIKLDFLSEYCALEADKEKYMHRIIVNYSDLGKSNFNMALKKLNQILGE